MRARTAAQLSNQQEQKDVWKFVGKNLPSLKVPILLIFDLRFIELHGGIWWIILGGVVKKCLVIQIIQLQNTFDLCSFIFESTLTL